MCGICVLLYTTSTQQKQDYIATEALKRRGPDGFQSSNITLTNKWHLTLESSVLHLRGRLTLQPYKDCDGNVLLWNGEVFNGLPLTNNDNDTYALANALRYCQDKQSFVDVMSQLEGPWAFVYWQARSRFLWFGRDILGRRSLLWHLPQNDSDMFGLCSIGFKNLVCTEVPCLGLYCIDFSSSQIVDNPLLELEIIPWMNWNVIPDKIQCDSLIQSSYSNNLKLTVNKENRLSHKILSLNKHISAKPPHTKDLHSSDFLYYMMDILENNQFLNTLTQKFLEVLEDAVAIRTINIPTEDIQDFISTNSQHSIVSSHESLEELTLINDEGSEQRDVDAFIKTYLKPTINCTGTITKKRESAAHNVESLTQEKDCNTNCKDIIAMFKNTTNGTTENIPNNFSTNAGNVCSNAKAEVIYNKSMDTTEKTYRAKGNRETNVKNKKSSNGLTMSSPLQNLSQTCSCKKRMCRKARVAILFSGGLDSAVIAGLTDRVLDSKEPIDLLNVAFAAKDNNETNTRATDSPQCQKTDLFNVPDRMAGLNCLSNLSSDRQWNFVQINVTMAELAEFRSNYVRDLIYPLKSVLDDSIGCAIWCAARGVGILSCECGHSTPYISPAKVVLVGMGADEQLAGYSRHRSAFQNQSYEGVINEIERQIFEISERNMGRDDRIISDHSRESRYPFLDERVISFLNTTPVQDKCDLTLPRGLGEKLLLRLVAVKLGLHHAAVLPKRAIQFGSRIAKLENRKEKASDVCLRLDTS